MLIFLYMYIVCLVIYIIRLKWCLFFKVVFLTLLAFSHIIIVFCY